MLWVTGRLIHFDRVASAWLISRFVDSDARFEFIEPGSPFPEGAATFSMVGGDIGRHDAEGTTFAKLRRKFALDDPGLDPLERIVAAGVAYVMEGYLPDGTDRLACIAVGLVAVAEGLLVMEDNDQAILERSLPVWDAIFVEAGMQALRTRALDPDSSPEPLRSTRFAIALARFRHVAGRARR